MYVRVRSEENQPSDRKPLRVAEEEARRRVDRDAGVPIRERNELDDRNDLPCWRASAIQITKAVIEFDSCR